MHRAHGKGGGWFTQAEVNNQSNGELAQCANFHKTMAQRLHVDQDKETKQQQKQAMAHHMSQLEKLTEQFSS